MLIGIGLVYIGYLHAGAPAPTIDKLAANRFVQGLPIDNELPRLWAEKLIRGDRGSNLHAEWQTSDRPPLATGVVLLFCPFFPRSVDGFRFGSHATGMLLQLWWGPAIWALLRWRGCEPGPTAAVVAALAITATPLIHTLYVWPKLGAASAVITAGVLYFSEPTRPMARCLLAAACSGLAWLAHGTSAFALLTLGILAVRPPLPSRAALLGAIAILGLFVLPWWGYQQGYAPPGNRLLKWHLAGVIDIDSRDSWPTVREAYAKLSPTEILHHKTANLRYPLVYGLSSWLRWPSSDQIATRYQSFYFLFAALGPWNLMWPLLLFDLGQRWFRRAVEQAPTAKLPSWGPVLGAVAINFALWASLLFGPATTSVSNGSLAVPLVLQAVLISTAWRTHPGVFISLLLWQVLIFLLVWMPPAPI